MRFLNLLIAVLAFPTVCWTDTTYVPDAYRTIQEAIDTSVNGDTVIGREGTYVENIDFIGKALRGRFNNVVRVLGNNYISRLCGP